MTETTFTIEHKPLRRCDLFRLKGRIDGSTAPEFEAALRQVMDNGRYKIVLNMAAVDYMSSAALRVLISASKEARKLKRGDVRLAAPNERIQHVLELAGLTELFQAYPSEVEAVDSF